MASRPRTAPAASASVRRAEASDLAPLVRMLVRAYLDDPVAVWMCRSEGMRAKLLAGLYSVRLRQMLAQRSIWTDAERTSAAAWTAPGERPGGVRPNAKLLRCALDPRVAARLPLLALGMRGVQRRHPQAPPHWYLSLVGTDPDAQGRGLGSATLAPVLERCDRDGVGAYLESSKPSNLDFYARFGFRQTGELRLPGGPRMWPMWREPRERHA